MLKGRIDIFFFIYNIILFFFAPLSRSGIPIGILYNIIIHTVGPRVRVRWVVGIRDTRKLFLRENLGCVCIGGMCAPPNTCQSPDTSVQFSRNQDRSSTYFYYILFCIPHPETQYSIIKYYNIVDRRRRHIRTLEQVLCNHAAYIIYYIHIIIRTT